MVAKLGFRKLNLIWQLSLEMLSLLRSKAHWIKYQSGCRSVLCVLEPINYTFLGSKDPFIRGAWQTVLSRVLHGKEEERMSFENYKTVVRGLGTLHSLQPFEKLWLLKQLKYRKSVWWESLPYPLPPTTSLLKHFGEKSLSSEFWESKRPPNKIKNQVVLFLNIHIW